jgi:putative addiction module CopG family antidote
LPAAHRNKQLNPRVQGLSTVDFDLYHTKLGDMEIRLSPDQEELIRQAIEAGRFKNAEDAVQEALLLWEQRERQAALAEFRATLDAAEASIGRGEGIPITQQFMRDLAADVKRRGRVRISSRPPRR